MTFNSRRVCFITGSFICVAFILYVVANASPTWSKIIPAQSSDVSYSATLGLWKCCITFNSVRRCQSVCHPDATIVIDTKDFLIPRLFLTLSCILSGISTLCVFVCGFITDGMKGRLYWIIKILITISLITGIIGVTMGIISTINIADGIKQDVDISLAVAVAAIIVHFFGGLSSIFLK